MQTQKEYKSCSGQLLVQGRLENVEKLFKNWFCKLFLKEHTKNSSKVEILEVGFTDAAQCSQTTEVSSGKASDSVQRVFNFWAARFREGLGLKIVPD